MFFFLQDNEKFDLIFSILQQLQNRQAKGSVQGILQATQGKCGLAKLRCFAWARSLWHAGPAGGDGACPANAGLPERSPNNLRRA